MSRTSLRVAAGLCGLALVMAQFLLQPDALAVWGNPKLAAVILGCASVGLGYLVNWLPSVTGATAGEKPPAT